MARLLVWTEDQDVLPDDGIGNQLWKRGDVVLVVEDDGKFGTEFDDHPKFRIIEYPGVPAEKYKYLTEREIAEVINPTDGTVVEVPTRERKFSVDMDAIDALLPGKIDEGALSPTEKEPISADESLAVKRAQDGFLRDALDVATAEKR